MPIQTDNRAVQPKLLVLLKIILETVKEAGPAGAPSGPMYLAFMQHGCSLDQYEVMTGTLVDAGFLRKEGHCYFWLKDFPS